MSTTKEYRIRELERQDARKAARIRSLKAGIARVMTGAILLRNYTENWDGPGGSGPPCTGNATILGTCNGTGSFLSGATVTATDGTHSVSGTANSSGSYTFAPGYAGVWTFTVAKAGFVTYNGSFTFACANISVAAPTITSSNTISGIARCPGSTAFPGVTVVVKESPSGTVLGTTTSGAGGAWSLSVSGYSTHSYTVTYSATNYAASTTGVLTMSCTGTTSGLTGGPALASGKQMQCSNCLVADATTLTFSSSGYTATLTYDGLASAYVGNLTVNCRAITGVSCSKSTADVSLLIRYFPATCGLSVTFKRQGRSSNTCPGGPFSLQSLPASDAWCTAISGLGAAACSDIDQYGNGTHSFTGATGYPYIAVFTGVLFYDADYAAFLTDATVSE